LCFYDTYPYLLLYIYNLLAFCSCRPAPLSIIRLMTINFKNDNNVVAYAHEKIISSTTDNRFIFQPQTVWWISSIIGLDKGLVIYIDNLNVQDDIGNPELRADSPIHHDLSNEVENILSDSDRSNHYIHPSRIARVQGSNRDYIDSGDESVSTTETNIHNEVIENCKLFLEQSRQERKAIGRKTREASRVVKRKPINRGRTSRPSELRLKELTHQNYEERQRQEIASIVLGYEIGKESIKLSITAVGKDFDIGTAPFRNKKSYNMKYQLWPFKVTIHRELQPP